MVNWYAYFGNDLDTNGYFDETDTSELFDGDASYDSAVYFDSGYGGELAYSNNSLVVEFPQAIPIRTIYFWI